MSKLSKFVQEFVAMVEGDDAKATALKTERQATSALKTRISHMEGDTVTKEQNIEDAKENLKKAGVIMVCQ